ncbi:MAG TPA: VWA domain-containing protein [Streptosporangiales bacterium]
MTRRDPSRYAYGRWHGGPDPLARPANLSGALDALSRDVLEGSSVRQALRELMRRGMPGQRGLDDLMQRVWRRRSEITRNNRLDGTLQEVRRLLDRAMSAERETLRHDDSDDARFREMQLDAVPPSTAQAVRELSEYDWRSSDAREAYDEIKRLLGQELLESRFAGIKQAMQQVTPQDVERIQRMLADLNDLLASHAAGDPQTQQKFEQFMNEHGQFFPENPRDVEELIDALAARSAAAQRMMNSLSPEQRAELAQLSAQAFGDPRLANQLAELDARLRAARPGEDWDSAERFDGDNPFGMGQGTQAMQDLADLDALTDELGQMYPGATLDDIDVERLAEHIGEDAAVDLQRLRELERELAARGLLERAADGSLMLSPKALRRLGETAFRDLVTDLAARRGEHDDPTAGAAGETTGSTRPWQFGDAQPFDTTTSVRNAVLRTAAEGRPTGGGVRLGVEDLEVVETERRTKAAIALCVDTSWSMVAEGRWVPMKRTALALHHLVSTRFRGDELALIGFGRYAQRLSLGELTGLDGAYEQGTNLHHALLLAQRHLRRFPGAQPIVLVVTDGEPTAHLEPDGEAYFNYPPLPMTLGRTLRVVDDLARIGTSLTVFRLGDEPRLHAFVDAFARRSGGRVVAPDLAGLGPAVVSDYLRTRRRSR